MCGASRSAARFTIGLVQETHIEQVELFDCCFKMNMLQMNRRHLPEQTACRSHVCSVFQRREEFYYILAVFYTFICRGNSWRTRGLNTGESSRFFILFRNNLSYCNHGDVSQTAFKISHLENDFPFYFPTSHPTGDTQGTKKKSNTDVKLQQHEESSVSVRNSEICFTAG